MNQISDFITDHVNDVLPDMPQISISPTTDTTHTQNPEKQKTINIDHIKSQLYSIKDEINNILRILEGNTTSISISKKNNLTQNPIHHTHTTSGEDTIIEGVFNGEKMIGSDGNEYAVPPNYASKSKLVEGDIMKLTITPTGRFIYKQINQIPRKRIIGEIIFDTEKQLWYVRVDQKDYKILTASVTFYKGKPGDEAIILVSEAGDSSWGAVDNIMTK